MECFEVSKGTHKSKDSITIGGSKNTVLPMFISTIMSSTAVNITNVPNILDIELLSQLLINLGANVEVANGRAIIDTSKLNSSKATYDIVSKMRASILVLGPLLGRFGYCEVSLPGGDAIGERPIDLHLKALEAMGAKITLKQGYIIAEAPYGLQGTHIIFDKITVTGSSNIIMAAAMANGKSILSNVAKEPDVVQLCEVLRDAGLDIKGIGTDELEIVGTGSKLLKFKDIDIIPDRIEAGTYLCIGAMLNKKLTIKKVNAEHINMIIVKLKEMGFTFDINENEITIYPTNEIKPVEIITQEYPGFPTDMQAQFMALSTQANGTSIIEEKIFENRFMHVSELRRMGADIVIKGDTAIIKGPSKLMGTDVTTNDLRAGMSLCMAGSVAADTTKVHEIYHIDRGYEFLEQKLTNIGINIKRVGC
ncbi:MAG: UDP-N-acetylglucosamine 1-carboxyvinyltransferase (EC [uncultured Campylobacterales bacterium]|uniref:UDP-N-acetylglucosamine 1-carboxyvinyltransferase n=1 Tax=uncultured Campylobacterales bacterium TaxID=352960 RepID=A0A6S6SV81_9BACT|nr:MAG: UDP-N-acetylglucosamine 1-carboxyvinyltransferase (EC [uncultured Campylobacterales bacterium]